MTRGRQNWLQDAYSDYLPKQGVHRAYRSAPLINNLFDEIDSVADDLKSSEMAGSGLLPDSGQTQSDDNQMPQGPKLFLLKLVEYNKIAMLEKSGSSLSLSNYGNLYDEEA